MDLKLYLCLLSLEKESLSNLPKYSIDFLEKYNTDSLCVIATLSENDYFNIKTNFENFLRDINFSIPSKDEARLFLLQTYVNDILDKSVDPIEALTFIRNNILLDSDWHNMSLKYAYDYINFEALYGLYWGYFDTLDYFERNPDEISSKTLHVEEIVYNIFEECRSFMNNFDKLKTKILT